MLIKVKVIPESKKYSVTKKSPDSYLVAVKEKAENGQANQAVLLLLSEHFHINKGLIRLVKGSRQPNKIYEIPVRGTKEDEFV